MKDVAAKLKTFYSSFDLPAYTLDSVPDEVEIPYITYPLLEPEALTQGNTYCQVWYPKHHLGELLTKADEITAAIGIGKRFDLLEGYLILYPTTPLIQIMSDDETQSAYINLLINAYHMPGV